MLFDSHMHVGQFYDRYTSPKSVVTQAEYLGLDGYAFSSTTICENNYTKVLHEIEELISIDALHAYPVLWITPSLLTDDMELARFIDSGIDWKCLKIHPDLNPHIWTEQNDYMDALLSISETDNLPIIIHTGSNEYSQAKIFEKTIATNPKRKFILAHCRPFEQALSIISNYENAYGDLAFVDTDDFHRLHELKACNRILWGSDLPIVEHYIDTEPKTYYDCRLLTLRQAVDETEFDKITSQNFNHIFNNIP